MAQVQAAQRLSGVLFALVPMDNEARWLVGRQENRARWVPSFGQFAEPSLVFSPNIPSRTAGRLATFGRHANHDIRLPASPRPPVQISGARSVVSTNENNYSGCRNYQNYRNDHCLFFLAESGELILRDLSPCLVHIELEQSTPDEARLYALHGDPRTGPRQRVVPRTYRPIYITIGTSTRFRLVWNRLLVEDQPPVQTYLAGKARGLAPPGMVNTPPARSDSLQSSGLHSRELRSRHTPSVASKAGPRKQCHKYAALGSGGFGIVYKCVDLSSGELWAVKETIGAEQQHGVSQAPSAALMEDLRASLIREVEMMAEVSHAHIVHYETYQDLRICDSFQIFYRLYAGNLLSLVSHSCNSPPPPAAPWMPRMIKQVTSAIDFLHKKEILHRDIKPENILFDHDSGDRQLNFYLGDFGLAKAQAEVYGNEWAGTIFHMAPEVRFVHARPCSANDIWSFAMTLGEVLGFWCADELEREAAVWATKLRVLGVKVPYTEPAELRQATRQAEAFYRRIAAIVVSGFLPPMFPRLLLCHTQRPTAAECSHTHTDFFIKRPSHPDPIPDWEGLKVPWLQSAPLNLNAYLSHPPTGHPAVQRHSASSGAPAGSAAQLNTRVLAAPLHLAVLPCQQEQRPQPRRQGVAQTPPVKAPPQPTPAQNVLRGGPNTQNRGERKQPQKQQADILLPKRYQSWLIPQPQPQRQKPTQTARNLPAAQQQIDGSKLPLRQLEAAGSKPSLIPEPPRHHQNLPQAVQNLPPTQQQGSLLPSTQLKPSLIPQPRRLQGQNPPRDVTATQKQLPELQSTGLRPSLLPQPLRCRKHLVPQGPPPTQQNQRKRGAMANSRREPLVQPKTSTENKPDLPEKQQPRPAGQAEKQIEKGGQQKQQQQRQQQQGSSDESSRQGSLICIAMRQEDVPPNLAGSRANHSARARNRVG